MATTSSAGKTDMPESLSERKELVKNLNNKSQLRKIALKDEFWEVRREATSKISEEKLLRKIATSDDYWQVRFEAVSKLSDEKFLANIVKNDDQSWVQKEAVSNIYSCDILSHIVMDRGLDEQVRTYAIRQISDLSTLTDLRSKVESKLTKKLHERIKSLQNYQ